MKRLTTFTLCLCLSVVHSTVTAFEITTHRDLAGFAVDKSVLTTSSVLADIGLPPITQGAYRTDTTSAVLTGRDAVISGADYEDFAFFNKYNERVFNHFFDVQNGGRGLTFGGARLGNSSPDWALEDQAELFSISPLLSLVIPPQQQQPQYYSFRNAQQYFFAALTSSDYAARQLASAKLLQSLGHVTHHLADMAQPQHVRNDQHIHPISIPFIGDYDPPWGAFEVHTQRRFTTAQMASLLSANPYNAGAIPQFPTAREFWHTPNATTPQYKGMAEFTAQNYPSYGTQFQGYYSNGIIKARAAPGFPLPSGIDATGGEKRVVPEVVEETEKSGIKRVRPVDFLKGNVYDGLGTNTEQRLALTSITAAHSRSAGIAPVFRDDPAVYDDMYRVLFPRAVAFSAGLINHFFRGRLSLVRSTTSNALLVGNMGQQAMNGNFYIYYEDAGGTRRFIPNASAKTSLLPGASFTISGFTEPVGATKLIVAFQGQIGSEGDPTTNSGWYAVAGKVIDYSSPPAPCPGTQSYTRKGLKIGTTNKAANGATIPFTMLDASGNGLNDNGDYDARKDFELGPVAGTVTVNVKASNMTALVWATSFDSKYVPQSIVVRVYTTTPEANEKFYYRNTFGPNVSGGAAYNDTLAFLDTTFTFAHDPVPPRRSIVRFYIEGVARSTYLGLPDVTMRFSCPGKPL